MGLCPEEHVNVVAPAREEFLLPAFLALSGRRPSGALRLCWGRGTGRRCLPCQRLNVNSLAPSLKARPHCLCFLLWRVS